MYKLKSQDSSTKARVGELETAHGRIKTPLFMPVATKTTVKRLTIKELKDIGVSAIITNAFVTYFKPGIEIIENVCGIHNFMNFDKVIFSDSGGFQMIRPSLFLDINNREVSFRNPFNMQKVTFTPEQIIEVQRKIGSDVIMCLDHVPPVLDTRERIVDAVKRTHLWAERCKKYHDRYGKKNAYGRRQLLFGITQGGIHRDLREKSAKFINSLDLDGVSIGGHCIGETKQEMFNSVKLQMQHISKQKPVYLMGVGSPEDLVEAISLGVDIFDSVFPTQNARHGHLFTKNGRIKINKPQYKQDFNPIDETCSCYVCKNYSRAYINHLMNAGDFTVHQYMTYHNIYFINNLMQNIQNAIEGNYFEQFKKEFLDSHCKQRT